MVYIYEFLRWFLMAIYNHKELIIEIFSAIVFLITAYLRYPWLVDYITKKFKEICLVIKNKFGSKK